MPFLCVGPSPWGDTGAALVRWASASEPGTVTFPSLFPPPSLWSSLPLSKYLTRFFSAYLGAQQVESEQMFLKQQRFSDGE